jgi:hypothetical protein
VRCIKRRLAVLFWTFTSSSSQPSNSHLCTERLSAQTTTTRINMSRTLLVATIASLALAVPYPPDVAVAPPDSDVKPWVQGLVGNNQPSRTTSGPHVLAKGGVVTGGAAVSVSPISNELTKASQYVESLPDDHLTMHHIGEHADPIIVHQQPRWNRCRIGLIHHVLG